MIQRLYHLRRRRPHGLKSYPCERRVSELCPACGESCHVCTCVCPHCGEVHREVRDVEEVAK